MSTPKKYINLPQNSQKWSKWTKIGQNFAFSMPKSTPPPVVTINMSYVCCVDLWPLKGLLLCLASSFDVSRIHM